MSEDAGESPPTRAGGERAPGGETGAATSVPDLVTAGVLLAVAVGVVAETGGYPGSLVPGAPGPAFFPRFLAAGLALLALLLGAQAVRGRRRADVPTTEGLGRTVLALLLVVGFLLGVESLGVFLLLPPLLGGVMAIMGERRAGMLVAVPLLFDLFVYVVFYRVFSVDLPTLLL
ncbi:MAG: hypothetical protein GWM92_06030 [Gemmatimonadetes bacterium]|nr:hypothetical protein [Gemmatimonadota bacterium]NIR78172.1 hypothetical protein [Gemmatimonadota bacterium]NIT86742.1 hypothetical protein [Gemmatimonadota bacterium]NIU30603.1 hypothetical protein [Gemmatimonadota bacterium]NIU35418.1 hypothetical protein [Gemmatimonadota bacterium]